MKTKGYYTTTKCIKTSFLCRFLSFFSIFFPLEKILSSQKCLVLSPFLHVSPATTPPTAPTKKNDDNDNDDNDDNDASDVV